MAPRRKPDSSEHRSGVAPHRSYLDETNSEHAARVARKHPPTSASVDLQASEDPRSTRKRVKRQQTSQRGSSRSASGVVTTHGSTAPTRQQSIPGHQVPATTQGSGTINGNTPSRPNPKVPPAMAHNSVLRQPPPTTSTLTMGGPPPMNLHSSQMFPRMNNSPKISMDEFYDKQELRARNGELMAGKPSSSHCVREITASIHDMDEAPKRTPRKEAYKSPRRRPEPVPSDKEYVTVDTLKKLLRDAFDEFQEQFIKQRSDSQSELRTYMESKRGCRQESEIRAPMNKHEIESIESPPIESPEETVIQHIRDSPRKLADTLPAVPSTCECCSNINRLLQRQSNLLKSRVAQLTDKVQADSNEKMSSTRVGKSEIWAEWLLPHIYEQFRSCPSIKVENELSDRYNAWLRRNPKIHQLVNSLSIIPTILKTLIPITRVCDIGADDQKRKHWIIFYRLTRGVFRYNVFKLAIGTKPSHTRPKVHSLPPLISRDLLDDVNKMEGDKNKKIIESYKKKRAKLVKAKEKLNNFLECIETKYKEAERKLDDVETRLDPLRSYSFPQINKEAIEAEKSELCAPDRLDQYLRRVENEIRANSEYHRKYWRRFVHHNAHCISRLDMAFKLYYRQIGPRIHNNPVQKLIDLRSGEILVDE